jgi:PilZ domain-containing protein
MSQPFLFRRTPLEISDVNRPGFHLLSGRREGRFAMPIPVIVFGFDVAGRVFQELAATRNVSRHGCCIRLLTQPQVDSPIAVRIVPREGPPNPGAPPLTYRYVWSRRVRGGGWEVGAAAFDEADLIRLAFPSHKP